MLRYVEAGTIIMLGNRLATRTCWFEGIERRLSVINTASMKACHHVRVSPAQGWVLGQHKLITCAPDHSAMGKDGSARTGISWRRFNVCSSRMTQPADAPVAR